MNLPIVGMVGSAYSVVYLPKIHDSSVFTFSRVS